MFVCMCIHLCVYIYMYMYMYLSVCMYVECFGFESHPRQLFFGKVTALGVLCCFALLFCLTFLSSFFLPSHLSLKHVQCIMCACSINIQYTHPLPPSLVPLSSPFLSWPSLLPLPVLALSPPPLPLDPQPVGSASLPQSNGEDSPPH